jgi:hypothetical protein
MLDVRILEDESRSVKFTSTWLISGRAETTNLDQEGGVMTDYASHDWPARLEAVSFLY